MQRLELRQPDDWHVHLRDEDILVAVAPLTARQFRRALVMPNLAPPVTTTAAAMAYRQRILAAVPSGFSFEPLMTLYLTDQTAPAEIERAALSKVVMACKLYPAGATTHSDAGVTEIHRLDTVFACMAEHGMVLSVHGEVVDKDVDIFDREERFIERTLAPLCERHPRLKVVFEHITTAAAVRFIKRARPGVAATLTPQHLLLNRNDMLVGGIRPHLYCLPILKTENDRNHLLGAATSDDARFFAGTDSAPHSRHSKESACGCAGVFSAHAAVELYATAFEQAGALDRLEAFLAERGADFYGVPRNTGQIVLERGDWVMDTQISAGKDCLIPYGAGQTLGWRLKRGD
ncbi:MAG: dihydroorotase [Steroidobacteraceae bacterium]